MFENLSEPLVNLRIGALEDALPTATMNPVALLLPAIAALAISMALIPVMVHMAPRLGMMDKPQPRKVHMDQIPRVGGIGIVLGALLPVVLLLPLDRSLLAYVFGALVLLGFGVLDDSRELGHYTKFIGQFVAVIAVVYLGDVYVSRLPFTGGEPVSDAIGRPFTVFAMVGMINAINHSDGLDGLAGGESLLSLGGIAYFSYMSGSPTVTVIAIAAIGGLFGFMRFNTHPARIFMGDGGSQFLGYTLGFLAVMLTQEVNPALSPALPALLLGLPIADIIAVLAQRVYHRMNWFKASRNHIHHRLLELGFHHYESVVIIYGIQALLVFSAVLMPYESDVLIAAVYLLVVAVVFSLLFTAERSGWRMHERLEKSDMAVRIRSMRNNTRLLSTMYTVVSLGISLYLVAGSLLATRIPVDFTVAASALFVLMVIRLLTGLKMQIFPLRLVVYVALVFIVYLVNTYQPSYLSGVDPFTYIFFGILMVAIALTIRFSSDDEFSVTPTDFLIVIAVLALAVSASLGVLDAGISAITLKVIILFYGCEMLLSKMKRRWNAFTMASLVALLIISVRGIVENVI